MVQKEKEPSGDNQAHVQKRVYNTRLRALRKEIIIIPFDNPPPGIQLCPMLPIAATRYLCKSFRIENKTDEEILNG